MDGSSFPTTAQVRQAHPGELAVLDVHGDRDVLAGLSVEQAEAVVVATQRVASWAHGVQAVAVDRFAEHVLDAQEAHAADLAAARDAQRASVEAGGGTWRGEPARWGYPSRSRSRPACWHPSCGSAHERCGPGLPGRGH